MSTGDIKNNIRKLQRLLRQVGYKADINIDGLTKGLPTTMLPIYHYIMTEYTPHMAVTLVEMEVSLAGTTDQRFVELLYKVLRNAFQYKPDVPKEKFFTAGFAERKVIMCTEVVLAVQKLHQNREPFKCKGLSKSMLATKHDQKTTTSQTTAKTTTKPEQKTTTSQATAKTTTKPEQKTTTSQTTAKTTTKPEPKTMAVSAHTTLKTTTKTERQKAMSAASLVAKKRTSPVPRSSPVPRPAYKAATYAAGEPVVVHMPVGLENEPHLRPIDIIAKTPGRPSGNNAVKSDTDYIDNLRAEIQRRTDELCDRMSKIENRVENMETVMRVEAPPINSRQMETMLARITLLETQFGSMDVQASNRPIEPVIVGPTADEWNAENGIQNGVFDEVAASSTPTESNNHPKTDILVSQHLHDDHLESYSRMMPSPIVADLIRQVERTSSAASEGSTEMSVNTEDNANTLMANGTDGNNVAIEPMDEVFENLSSERSDQVHRIETMLKMTEATLKV